MKRTSSRRLSTPKRLRGAASVDVDRDGTPGKRARSEPPRLSAAVESLIAELEGKPPAGHVKAFKISDAVRHIASADAHYEKGSLSDSILLDPELSEADLSSKLLAVKGIGPWSAHMYQMFSLHLPDVFPTGDLGVRNGMAKAFGLRGSAKSGGLDEKKDMEKLLGAMEPYRPYRAVASWYMWRVCETPSFME